jgi:hypothetical protein
MDVEYNALCPIILGRPFLRTVGAVIDRKEGTIKYQFPLKKGMENFPRRRNKLLFDSILRANYELDASSLDITVGTPDYPSGIPDMHTIHDPMISVS